MRLSELETFIVATPPPHFGGQYWIFVKLITDCGVHGYGEVYSVPFRPNVVEAMIADVFERKFLHQDSFDIEKIWRQTYSSGYTQRPDSSLVAVLSGLEMACWDINGKATDKAVHKLLGGLVNDRLRSYTYLYPAPDDATDVYANADLAAERAAEYVAMGFSAVKFDPTGPYSAFDPRQLSLSALERSETFVAKIRSSVGTRCDLLFGTHGQMTPASAVRLARRLEAYDPLWLEEPVPPEMPEQMREVALKTSIPIATGERLSTRYEFARVLNTKAASIMQMAIGRVGGLLEAKKIATMAEAYYAQIAPHLYCGPIEAAANIQLAACSPNFLILESIQRFDGFHAEILQDPLQWDDGYVIPSAAPGLGIELNEKLARQCRYDADDLHLDMHSEPVI